MQVLLEPQSSDLSREWRASQLKYSINGEITAKEVKEELALSNIDHREILDLLLAPMSPNRVARHFSQVFQKSVSAWTVKQFLLSQGKRITRLNERFDKIAGRKVIILQIDETFKGQKVSILVVLMPSRDIYFIWNG
jgi:hypothetical protein